MKKIVFESIGKIASLINKLHFDRAFAILAIGLLILTTNIDPTLSKQDAIGKVDKMLQQDSDLNHFRTAIQSTSYHSN